VCSDVPREETPKRTPNPMIVEIEALIPHQGANTRDPSIETPPFRAGRVSYMFPRIFWVLFKIFVKLR
jgi:hypothetical protein